MNSSLTGQLNLQTLQYCCEKELHALPRLRTRHRYGLVVADVHRHAAAGLHVDPARKRRPKDKARVERTVRDVRDGCFAGEKLLDLADARRPGRTWSADEYGMRRHTATQRMPREHFEADEKPHLLPAPTAPYDIPLWCEPKVGADQHAQVARALYSLQFEWRNQRVRARADSSTVPFYDPVSHEVVKVHPRVAPGRRSTDLADFPPEKAIYASRDAEALINRARSHGAAICELAQKLFAASPLPWTRMRQLGMLLGPRWPVRVQHTRHAPLLGPLAQRLTAQAFCKKTFSPKFGRYIKLS